MKNYESNTNFIQCYTKFISIHSNIVLPGCRIDGPLQRHFQRYHLPVWMLLWTFIVQGECIQVFSCGPGDVGQKAVRMR
jgi:hypothetical protein